MIVFGRCYRIPYNKEPGIMGGVFKSRVAVLVLFGVQRFSSAGV